MELGFIREEEMERSPALRRFAGRGRLEDWRLAGYHVQRGERGRVSLILWVLRTAILGALLYRGPTTARGLRGGGSE